jgi:hypothetical protein
MFATFSHPDPQSPDFNNILILPFEVRPSLAVFCVWEVLMPVAERGDPCQCDIMCIRLILLPRERQEMQGDSPVPLVGSNPLLSHHSSPEVALITGYDGWFGGS